MASQLSRHTPLRRTRMRRVGTKGRARAVRLDGLRPMIEARANGRCENPFCRRPARLDLDHIIKRSQGGVDTTGNIVGLDRACHRRKDLPRASPRRLVIRRFMNETGQVFALFESGPLVQAVPLAVPELIAPSGTIISTSVDK